MTKSELYSVMTEAEAKLLCVNLAARLKAVEDLRKEAQTKIQEIFDKRLTDFQAIWSPEQYIKIMRIKKEVLAVLDEEEKVKTICRNPHEKVYRGCSEKCEYFENCDAKEEKRGENK
jgi:hypothetical protein